MNNSTTDKLSGSMLALHYLDASLVTEEWLCELGYDTSNQRGENVDAAEGSCGENSPGSLANDAPPLKDNSFGQSKLLHQDLHSEKDHPLLPPLKTISQESLADYIQRQWSGSTSLTARDSRTNPQLVELQVLQDEENEDEIVYPARTSSRELQTKSTEVLTQQICKTSEPEPVRGTAGINDDENNPNGEDPAHNNFCTLNTDDELELSDEIIEMSVPAEKTGSRDNKKLFLTRDNIDSNLLELNNIDLYILDDDDDEDDFSVQHAKSDPLPEYNSRRRGAGGKVSVPAMNHDPRRPDRSCMEEFDIVETAHSVELYSVRHVQSDKGPRRAAGGSSASKSKKKRRQTLPLGGNNEDLPVTTVMISNLDRSLRNEDLLQLLEKHYKFLPAKHFDFLHLPKDFQTKQNLGYCFLNFKQPEFAEKMLCMQQGQQHFHHRNSSGSRSSSSSANFPVMNNSNLNFVVKKADRQGFAANVEPWLLEKNWKGKRVSNPFFRPVIFSSSNTTSRRSGAGPSEGAVTDDLAGDERKPSQRSSGQGSNQSSGGSCTRNGSGHLSSFSVALELNAENAARVMQELQQSQSGR
ncbi:unnamed protein product [Amoebophrya sp. A120]|nr:unnamed protein product [Amoebophrya sp. A120]|eukprot:GSA120T00009828001.1